MHGSEIPRREGEGMVGLGWVDFDYIIFYYIILILYCFLLYYIGNVGCCCCCCWDFGDF